MISSNMWWGYLHNNGQIQVKRWFGDTKDYSRNEDGDCWQNPFVVEIVEPFEAKDQNEAYNIIAARLVQLNYKQFFKK